MITTLLENPWPILAIGILAVALAVGAMVATGKKAFLAAALGVVVLVAGLLALEWTVETDVEQVEQALFDLAADVERNDVDAVVARISPQAVRLRQEARSQLAAVTVRRVGIKSNLEIAVYPKRNPPLAEARFNVVITGDVSGSGLGGDYPRYFVCNFRNEDGQWRLYSYENLDPIRRE
jgi:hypothetical protein